MIHYFSFRAWGELQKRTNNTVVALSIGTHLAERELSRAGLGERRAPEVLANIARADRLDVTAAKAREVFRSTASDLAFLAIPQIAATHIELMVGTLEECEAFPGIVKPHKKGLAVKDWNAADLRKAIRFGEQPTNADRLIEFCVKLRNSIMHGVGRVDPGLVAVWENLPAAAKARWESLAGRSFTYERLHARPSLAWGEVKATLAVTKESAAEINARMERILTRDQWAALIVHDYRRVSPRRFHSSSPGKLVRDGSDAGTRRTERALLRLHSHAGAYYHPLAITLDELHAARERVV
ncbi:hypothetical protein [Streptomyces sp. NPDC056188]|uniref:hypothetical protein n=1 Tax=Streptomyces sp. NPDC056188 TaxID=3345740 RepID=UPI0035DD8256